MGTNLKRLERKKLETGLNRLSKFGIDVQRWLAMLDAPDDVMRDLTAHWPVFQQPYAYDAVTLLATGNPSEEPLPEARSGEIVIRYGGWSLRQLCNNSIVRERNLMHVQDWYHKYAWCDEQLPAGIYRLRIPIPNSNRKNFAEQEQMFSEGEQFAPVVLTATALLVHRMATGEDLLKNDWTRCKEQTADGFRVALSFDEGRLHVGYGWDGYRDDRLWSSSVRTSRS